eukprot:scaffold752_cov322-Pavlova_lutheri.AAC.22
MMHAKFWDHIMRHTKYNFESRARRARPWHLRLPVSCRTCRSSGEVCMASSPPSTSASALLLPRGIKPPCGIPGHDGVSLELDVVAPAASGAKVRRFLLEAFFHVFSWDATGFRAPRRVSGQPHGRVRLRGPSSTMLSVSLHALCRRNL